MYLEFIIDGKVVYYQVPDFHTVLATHIDKVDERAKGPLSGDYSGLVADASIVASITEVVKNVSDAGVRDALHGGVRTAIQALEKKAGKNVTVKE